MFSAERLSAIEMICIQSHVTAGMTTDEVASEMAKQVGKVASNDLIVDTDESFCDVMSGRYRGWAHLSTLNELDCPADAAGADSVLLANAKDGLTRPSKRVAQVNAHH